MKKSIMVLGITAFLCISGLTYAEPPTIKSATPVIYLSDNLDEKDKLGWCIDTEGRGFADTLQAHSCKPDRGNANDTQFSYHDESGEIRSVPYKGKCMTYSAPENTTHPFGLLDCISGKESQRFAYDAETKEIRLGTNTSKCVAVSPDSIIAGPFMSRDLIVVDCNSVDKKFKQWIVE